MHAYREVELDLEDVLCIKRYFAKKFWNYPPKLLIIVGLLLQPLLCLVWGRALLGLLNAHLNSPERTHRPILVSLLSGSEILGGDTLGKDLALSEGCASCMCWSAAQQRGLFGGKRVESEC